MTDRAGTVVVLAKEPRPGLAKTRLQAAFSSSESASLAAAALADTLAAVRHSSVRRRLLAWQGDPAGWRAGFDVVPQPAGSLNDRLTAAFASALDCSGDSPALLIGMDTPQVTGTLLDSSWDGADAVLGLSDDGGFWAIGLRQDHPPGIFDNVPMSTIRTGSAQLARLLELGMSVTLLPPLRDVDVPEDAAAVAYRYPHLRFSQRYASLVDARSDQPGDRLFDRLYDRHAVANSTMDSATGDNGPLRLDLARWAADADEVDLMVVARCQPPVIDLGCGPGRMVRALNESGRAALGVDMSATAVDLSMARGGPALRRLISEPLPGEGRWGTALLMDSNIGMGGDVPALLLRCRALVGPGGLIICEVDDISDRHEVHHVRLSSEQHPSALLAWSQIGVRALHDVAARCELLITEEWSSGHRTFVALRSGVA
jgi:glycosyltransferase A (GT-A) superfamily protein (DUF2064 family)